MLMGVDDAMTRMGTESEEGRAEVRHIVSLALAEDLDSAGDITSKAIFGPDEAGAARIVAREGCTVSGMAAAAEVCLQVDPDLSFLPLIHDGERAPAGAEVARLDGRILSILAAERTMLNFLSRLSGIATLTAAFVAAAGAKTRVAATRKTDPGMRLLEKQAVVHGGGELHRLGLYDAVLIKDNHIAAAGGVAAAIARVRESLGGGIEIEVEVDDAAQLEEALAAGVGRILLDNMAADEVAACVRTAGGRAVIEASGGIGLAEAASYAAAGVDVISAGALTRSAAGVDFSLEAVADGR